MAILQTVTTVNYEPVVATPKTKRSRRVIYLDDHTIGVLRTHRRQQYDEKRIAGPAWADINDLVFRDNLGDIINPDWFSAEFVNGAFCAGRLFGPRTRVG